MNIKQLVTGALGLGQGAGSCHGAASDPVDTGLKEIAIVGTPNVGKSVIFHRLTGVYVTVSNYPGTTVDVTRGRARLAGEMVSVVDTPGMYSLLPITEEERVARRLLFEEKPRAVLHVVDARNLERMLSFTIQLIEAGFPVVLDLNMMDEVESAGGHIDTAALEKALGIPVVATVATTGRGLAELRRRLEDYVRRDCPATV
ncbi:MAG: FeoB small GTPase domain-containing protein [Chloroflexota bacterium]